MADNGQTTATSTSTGLSSSPSDRLNAIPILYTSGTYYEVGFHVGRTFRGLIEDFVNSSKSLNDVMIPAYQTPAGRRAYELTLKCLLTNYPHYIRELGGTADGAGTPFYKLMLLHMDLIVPKNSGQDGPPCPPRQGSYGCSSFCSNGEHQVVLGHTEDALPETLNHTYIVSAHIKEDSPQGRWKTEEEGFTALCYAGHLPGFCMGYNHHGLVYSINVIFPEKVLAGKTPRHFLTRALLSAETMEQAQLILRDKGVGSADGLSVNITFMRQEGDHLFHNAEVGPAENCEESPMSVLTISPGEYFAHANRYLRLNIAEDLTIDDGSSDCRMARAVRSYPIDSREIVLNLLSNTEDEDYPIFREGEDGKKDTVKTVAVGLFDVLEKNWTIWMKNPKTSEPIVTLPMAFQWVDKL